jgi:hypothetical protein
MDKHLQILQLCLPRLTPSDVCMLRCTCSELRDMPVSWHEHSIDFHLGDSPSAIAWLHDNIVSMHKLSLTMSSSLLKLPRQDLLARGT